MYVDWPPKLPEHRCKASKSQQKHDVVLQGTAKLCWEFMHVACTRAIDPLIRSVWRAGHSRPVTYITFDETGKVLYTCGKDICCSYGGRVRRLKMLSGTSLSLHCLG